jgi:hypothetical protein
MRTHREPVRPSPASQRTLIAIGTDASSPGQALADNAGDHLCPPGGQLTAAQQHADSMLRLQLAAIDARLPQVQSAQQACEVAPRERVEFVKLPGGGS